ncbi:hypothetical protein BJ875DRAFT_504372 [Amylocarpus encephaloides]|uniref:DUF7881 domain-containing protein n=1 Tax=Amylocarpus encephaloides TaxID=45428 RepID=A0A9P7YJM5_9HELO|nr:hypothetical protein BJ875DRAFT_504372 [Amylocarpus encephaloides]
MKTLDPLCRPISHNRSGGRNVHIFNTRDRSTLVGGLVLTTGVTNTNLYTMIEIFVIFSGEYVLQNGNRRYVIIRQVAIGASSNSRWDGFEAAHIFPLAFEGLWNDYNYGHDNYKIVCFYYDRNSIARTHCLRWNFPQALLVNMKGAGEPIFEHDFVPGSDIMGIKQTWI